MDSDIKWWTLSCLISFSLMKQVFCEGNILLTFSTDNMLLEVWEERNISISASKALEEDAVIYFDYDSDGKIRPKQEGRVVISPLPPILLSRGESMATVNIIAINTGTVVVGINSSSPQFKEVETGFLRVTVLHSLVLDVIGTVIGWVYSIAWSICFIPQIYTNIVRKSVVGLDFDYLLYSFLGFLPYTIFNIGLTTIDIFKEEYHALHPRSLIPVQPNDVIMTIALLSLNGVLFIQCCIYERGGQKFSRLCLFLCSLALVYTALILTLAAVGEITWLQFLYDFSYIKIASVLIKYIPQAYLNYSRKSTVGWSVVFVFLDITGGVCSLAQMLILASNADDWVSLLGNPVKVLLGIFSVTFDTLFLIQHFVLYRNKYAYLTLEGASVKENHNNGK